MPWVTVSGQLLIGDEARGGEQVVVNLQRPHDLNKPRPYYNLIAATDDQGNFVLDRVPAGEGIVGRRIQLNERSWTTTASHKFNAEPGESIHGISE